MDYRKETIKIINTINQEKVLRFFHSFLEAILSDPNHEEIISMVVDVLGAE